jgi:hypothetical protein
MADFEIVVRPVVFPNIRPAPAQPSRPADDATKDTFVIHGSAAKAIDLPFSWSINTNPQKASEIRRRVDLARVYQKDDDGNINEDTFIDVEVANKFWMNEGGTQSTYRYTPIKEADNIEIKDRNVIRRADQ